MLQLMAAKHAVTLLRERIALAKDMELKSINAVAIYLLLIILYSYIVLNNKTLVEIIKYSSVNITFKAL